jgi:competence protein ComEC
MRDRFSALVLSWVAAEQARAALFLPVCMLAGVLGYEQLRAEPPVWLGIAGFGLALLGAVLLRRHAVGRAGFAVMAAFALGFASAGVSTWFAAPLVELPTRAVIVIGQVRAVDVLPEGRRVLIEAPSLDGGRSLPRDLRIRLRVDDPVVVATGDRLRVRAMVQPPGAPAFPGGWDVQREAFFAGLAGFGYALGPAERLAAGDARGILRGMQRLREVVAAKVQAQLDGSVGALSVALLTGATAQISRADQTAFRDSGLSHLLAVSGMNVSIVMGFWFVLIRTALLCSERATLHWPVKSIAAVGAIVAGGLLMLFTGAQVPVVRAFAMACLVTLAVLTGRRALSLRTLALAMAIVVLVAPSEVLGVSLQMSFAAVLALIAGYAALRPMLTRLAGEGGTARWIAGHLVALVLTSLLAGTASLPFGAHHFGRIQVYYVLANMVAVPLTSIVAMPAGMIALLLMPLGLEGMALAPMGWSMEATLWIARFVAAWPEAVVAVPHMPGWGLAVLSLGMAWWALWRSPLRLAGVVMVGIGIASPGLSTPPDILVSADARLIGVRRGGEVWLRQGPGGSNFTRDSWMAYWGERTWRSLPGCEGVCPLLPGVLLLGAGAPVVCDGQLLISAEPIRNACPVGRRIDRFTVWREGAQAVWLRQEGAVILSDRANRGARPWVLPLPTRTRLPPGVTLAPALED